MSNHDPGISDPYLKINLILALLVMSIFIYCWLFPYLDKEGYTVPSSCEGLPVAYCKSRGLTRAFVSILHGEFEKALKFNAYSFSVFIFFCSQLVGRIILSVAYVYTKKSAVIYVDIAGSIAYFLIVFLPLSIGL